MFKRLPKRLADYDAETIHYHCAMRMREFDRLPKPIREFAHKDVHISLKKIQEIFQACNNNINHTLQELTRYCIKKQEAYEQGMWETGGREIPKTKWRKGKEKNMASTEDLLS